MHYNNATLLTKQSKFRFFSGASLGAAFLMANSSIGPGFLTQTSVFTQQLFTSFGFVILVSVLLDIGAQLNTWRVLTISERRAQDLANDLLPGLGYFLSALVIMGGFAFNIGNIAGCGLGVNVLAGLSFEQGAVISCVIALILFWIKEVGKMLDNFTKILGTLKILLTLVIAFAAHPPLLQAVHHTFIPEQINTASIVTIVGGTVGGYITFSGAHRLLDAGIKGSENIHTINRSAISGVVISTVMRFILFLAIVGVVQKGVVLDKDNPAATVFASAAGQFGLKIFGVVLWSAAISSVVGAAYTSVSFFKTFHPFFAKHERWCISVFIVLTTIIFVAVGKPKQLLILAGAVNGLILPVALAIILIAATQKRLMKGYTHPLWMQIAGWVVVAAMGYMGWVSLAKI
ncbi:NRAMP family divalent metal transporter [Flavisolibacter ginsenosidimutans]|uniref:Divalent metal cation transporter n=1 Tax=Flavisolibacter ginsenosidimutans TaxID=661481 RepID=A0A5B8UK24_9BACT|nr:NRAMP family divalent metal transporter [Flavisolibacter ginsenosidimutans]QEC57047.1 divalent metal cation transporter [Flavisolibacter ginsenosidimutans]